VLVRDRTFGSSGCVDDTRPEGIDAPVAALHAALEQEKIPRERFVALQPGQVVEI
jgi:hypothetical protein